MRDRAGKAALAQGVLCGIAAASLIVFGRAFVKGLHAGAVLGPDLAPLSFVSPQTGWAVRGVVSVAVVALLLPAARLDMRRAGAFLVGLGFAMVVVIAAGVAAFVPAFGPTQPGGVLMSALREPAVTGESYLLAALAWVGALLCWKRSSLDVTAAPEAVVDEHAAEDDFAESTNCDGSTSAGRS